MSFLKKTGTGNPFASGSQQNAGGGGQPPRGYQGNNNHNNSGGGGRGFNGQQNQNKPSGGRGGGSGSSNPFASGKPSGGNQGSGNYGHQVSFQAQSHNPPGKQPQHQNNNNQFNQQSGGKSANPFASGGRGGGGGGGNMGGSMEMEGSNNQFQQSQFGKQQFQQPRPQNNNNFNKKGGGSVNPFASASQQQGGGNPFANATAAPAHGTYGQHSGLSQGQVNNVFANPSSGMFNQQSQHHQQPQSQHQQHFQSQPQQTSSFQQGGGHAFGQSSTAPQKSQFGGGGNPFFGGGGGGGGGGQQQQHNHQGQQFSAPSAPVRAEVNQQAINAVNMSAALAPSHVQELDLGLGLAPGAEQGAAPSFSMFSTGPSVASSAGKDGSLHHSSTSVSGGAANDAEDTAARQVRDLIKSIATSCPASALSEDPPQEEDVYKLMNVTSDSGLVAGRVPAVPPARRTPTAAGAVGFSKPQQINPFTSNAALGVAR